MNNLQSVATKPQNRPHLDVEDCLKRMIVHCSGSCSITKKNDLLLSHPGAPHYFQWEFSQEYPAFPVKYSGMTRWNSDQFREFKNAAMNGHFKAVSTRPQGMLPATPAPRNNQMGVGINNNPAYWTKIDAGGDRGSVRHGSTNSASMQSSFAATNSAGPAEMSQEIFATQDAALDAYDQTSQYVARGMQSGDGDRVPATMRRLLHDLELLDVVAALDRVQQAISAMLDHQSDDDIPWGSVAYAYSTDSQSDPEENLMESMESTPTSSVSSTGVYQGEGIPGDEDQLTEAAYQHEIFQNLNEASDYFSYVANN